VQDTQESALHLILYGLDNYFCYININPTYFSKYGIGKRIILKFQDNLQNNIMNILLSLLPGLALNLVINFIIIRLIYYPANRNRQDYVFTFFIFSTLIYFIVAILRDIEISMGFGFGLFAVFAMLRYRTWPIPIKEMTYLFLCVSLPLMNTLWLSNQMSYTEIIILNAFIAALVYVLEQQWGMSYEVQQKVLYEKIELIQPENYDLLIADLRERLGKEIKRCEISSINLLRDTATLNIYYDAQQGQTSSNDNFQGIPRVEEDEF